MNSSDLWWASGLFTITGVLITSLAAVVVAAVNRRTETRRLSRQQKVEAYLELLHVASRLERLPVWPKSAGDPVDLHDEVDQVVQRVRVFAPGSVKQKAVDLLASAGALAEVIGTIRTTSKPAHGDLIDQRDTPGHRDAVQRLRTESESFLTAVRIDLEVDRR